MKIQKLNRRTGIEASKKLVKSYNKMQLLIDALNKKDIHSSEESYIRDRINEINNFRASDKELIKIIKINYINILKFAEENLKFVPKHRYRTQWMIYGMLAGLLLSTISGSIGMFEAEISIGLGLPLGMMFGAAIGTIRDQEVEKNGNQLEIVAKENY